MALIVDHNTIKTLFAFMQSGVIASYYMHKGNLSVIVPDILVGFDRHEA